MKGTVVLGAQQMDRIAIVSDAMSPEVFVAFGKAVETWGRVSSEEREQIVSETMLRFWVKRDTEQIRELLPWLLSVARHAKWELRRRRRRETDREREIWEDRCRQLKFRCESRQDRKDDVLQKAEFARTSRLGREVTAALGRLNENHRRIVLLVVLRGLHINDAAMELGVCRSTAKSWLDRALKHLEDLLEAFRPRKRT